MLTSTADTTSFVNEVFRLVSPSPGSLESRVTRPNRHSQHIVPSGANAQPLPDRSSRGHRQSRFVYPALETGHHDRPSVPVDPQAAAMAASYFTMQANMWRQMQLTASMHIGAAVPSAHQFQPQLPSQSQLQLHLQSKTESLTLPQPTHDTSAHSADNRPQQEKAILLVRAQELERELEHERQQVANKAQQEKAILRARSQELEQQLKREKAALAAALVARKGKRKRTLSIDCERVGGLQSTPAANFEPSSIAGPSKYRKTDNGPRRIAIYRRGYTFSENDRVRLKCHVASLAKYDDVEDDGEVEGDLLFTFRDRWLAEMVMQSEWFVPVVGAVHMRWVPHGEVVAETAVAAMTDQHTNSGAREMRRAGSAAAGALEIGQDGNARADRDLDLDLDVAEGDEWDIEIWRD